MESDDELVKLKSKVEYIQTVIEFLDSTIKQISNRGFQIKNAIDWRKFTSGRNNVKKHYNKEPLYQQS